MPPKRKIQINKDIVKKTNKKLSGKKNPKKIIGTSREQTRRESSQTGQSAKRTKTGTRPSQPTKENETMDISLEETSRKRLSNDSDTSAEEPIKVPSAAKRLRLTEVTPLEKAIEEVVREGGASSESEISEEQTAQSSTESFLANVEKLLEMPQLSDDEEGSLFSQDEDLEYLKQHELDDIPDFFENFGDIPQVEDVSLDLAEEVQTGNLQAGELTESMDTGKFVNPLTGESSSSSRESLKQEVETKPLKEMFKKTVDLMEEDEEPIIDQVSVDITIISDQEIEAEGTTQQMADEEDTFNQFLELETQGPTELVDEIDVEALARQETARLLLEQTYEFVQNLIDQAVYRAEYVDPQVILRQNLDKHKLMRELQDKLAILEVERRGKQFLNRKCVEYFRRKRSFRPITEDNPKTINQEYRKYLAAVQSLDKWLIREQEAKSLSKRNTDILAGELQELKDRSLQESSNLDELIRRTLNRENFDRLHQIVENSLMKMNAVRKEISKVRFQLIQKQHNMASLVEVSNATMLSDYAYTY